MTENQTTTATVSTAPSPKNGRFKWYVVNVYSGMEKKFIQSLTEMAERKGLSEYFEEFLVPSEEVVEVKAGVKTITEKQCFPGYILMKMELTDQVWHLVSNLPKFSSFLGSQGKPTAISEREVNRIMNQVKESAAKPKHVTQFEVGEQLRVCDGPFATFTGIVEEIDDEKGRLKVSVTIFGRSTPVDLEFNQVEKV